MIAVIYWALARVGFLLAIPPGNISPVYPAAGFAAAVVLLRGRRVWLGVLLGQFLSNTGEFADFSTPMNVTITLAVGIAIAWGATCQAFAAALPATRPAGPPPTITIFGIFCILSANVLCENVGARAPLGHFKRGNLHFFC